MRARPARALACALAALACAPDPAPPPPPSPFAVEWDPATGKGAVVQSLPSGDRYRLCLHCRWKGYAGGLWAGSLNGAGFRWLPAEPAGTLWDAGLFCAQDESLVDRDDGTEHAPGWSENLGRGDDGVRLEYAGGAVLDPGTGPDGLLLRSVNRGGGLEVQRFLSWPRGAAHVRVASHVRNLGDRPRRLALWTGDDPWVGLYATSAGDVGWSPQGVVLTESCMPGADFRFGGIADLGNPLLGDDPGAASGVANLLAPDPAFPPDLACFANGFAHGWADVDPGRALEPWTPTALNLGWTALDLAPGASVRIAYAYGRADRGPDGLPRPPDLPADAWRFDAAHAEAFREAGPPPPAAAPDRPPLPVRFAAEDIRVTLSPGRLSVDARYRLQNRTAGAQSATVLYPFPRDADHPFPDRVEVEGVPWRAVDDGLLWRLDLQPGEAREIVVRYSQACLRPVGRYVLTTTGRWGEPLPRAALEVRWPASWRGVRVSYPGPVTVEGDEAVWRNVFVDFRPDRDLAAAWIEPPGDTPPPAPDSR